MRTLPGRLLMSFDEPISKSKFGLIIPSTAQRLAKTGFVHLHEPLAVEDLNNKRVIVDRWAGRPFPVVVNGKEFQFYCLPESCVLAVIEEEKKMTRDELKSELCDLVDAIVDDNRELTQEDEDKLSEQFGDVIDDTINAHEDEDVESDSEPNKGQ